MQDIDNENASPKPGEDVDILVRDDAENRIGEAAIREMFGESDIAVRRRRASGKRRRRMADGEIYDPVARSEQKQNEEKSRKSRDIDIPDFVHDNANRKRAEKSKPAETGLIRIRQKAKVKKRKEEKVPEDSEDMIHIDEIREKVKNDDGKMSTRGFLIAMAALFIFVCVIVLVTFTVSRMSRAITGNSDSSTRDVSSAKEHVAASEQQQSEPEPSAFERLGDDDVLAALSFMADPVEIGDVSTRDLAQYLPEMPSDSQEIVRTESDTLYTYERMVRDLYFLSIRFPNLLTVNTLGTTKDGRAIYDAMLGDPSVTRHFVVVYAQHGSEHINTQLAMRQIEYVLTTWNNGGSYGDKTFSDIFSNACFHVLPMANPDGVTISQLGIEGLRTEEAKTVVRLCYDLDRESGKVYGTFEDYLMKFKANANGVDLNKNFNAGWEAMDNNVNAPSTDGYKGPGAVSEPETRAVVSLAENYPLACVIGVHSPGDRIVWNYGAAGDVLTADKSLADTLRALTGYPLTEESHYTNRVAGGMAEYFISERNLPAVSILTGQGALPVDMSYFADIFGLNLNVIPAVAYLYDVPTDEEIAAEEAALAAEAAAEEAAVLAEREEDDNYHTYNDGNEEDYAGDEYETYEERGD